LTTTMMQHLALIAAEHIPQFEVLEHVWPEKEDVPSGMARELAEKLGDVQKPRYVRPIGSLHGPHETRGASINGVQVHCIRMPGFTLRCEAIFGMKGEDLVISNEAGQSA
jgi:4-hydroxy-tetrahydrodipicolinate reductase